MAKEAKDAVIIGGGPLGIEVAEALTEAGARVTMLESRPQILRMFDVEIAALVHSHLESKGVRVLTIRSLSELKEDRQSAGYLSKVERCPPTW